MPKRPSGGSKIPKPTQARKSRRPNAGTARVPKATVLVPALTSVSAKQISWYKRLNYRRRRSDRQEANLTRRVLPPAWEIGWRAARLIWSGRGLLAGVTLIYALLDLLVGQGLVNHGDISGFKSALSSTLHGRLSDVGSSVGHFIMLASSSTDTSNSSAGAYQFILVVITSLALIYGLRQITGKAKTRVRDTFYKGMYPFVPFILVILVMIIQLLPLLIGTALFYIAVSGGIAVGGIEKTIWTLIFVALTLASFYMLSSSLFGLYIVSLPNMTPMKALQSARHLSRFRHWLLFRKILFLPLVLVVIFAAVMTPVVLYATALTQWVFFLLSIGSLVVIHGYLYTFYRELIGE